MKKYVEAKHLGNFVSLSFVEYEVIVKGTVSVACAGYCLSG